MQVIVFGMHRSGTSALTRVLGLMGCYAGKQGEFVLSDAANPRGYWERRDVLAVDEAILQALGGSWWNVGKLDLEHLGGEDLPELEARAREVVRELDAHRPWVIKDPRLCLVFPLWRGLLEQPVSVLITRDPVAAARSLQERYGFPLAYGIALWERYLLGALASTRGLPRIAVSYHQLLAEPVATARRLRKDLAAFGVSGLHDPAESEVADSVEPSLDHYRWDEERLRGHLNAQQLALYSAAARASTSDFEPPPLSPGARDLLIAYPRLLAEREALHGKIAADTAVYLLEREARLRGEDTIAVLQAEIEALRAKIASDTAIYNAEREARLRGEEAIAGLQAERDELRRAIAGLEARLRRSRSPSGLARLLL